MEMLPTTYLDTYKKVVSFDVDATLGVLIQHANGGFDFLLEAGSVYSSQIEGNTMDLNSFMNAKTAAGPNPKEFQEIADLKSAYDFARGNALTEENFLHAHATLSRPFVSEGGRGAYRQDKVCVFSSGGLVYMAVEAEHVPEEMHALFERIAQVVAEKPGAREAFYYSALAHLQFVHIHPFSDGNGRAARLLEKWLLSLLIGEKAWLIESEKYYWEHRSEYYAKINLGVNYYELDYGRAVPFLLMLQWAIRNL
jgi:Fic family protein